MVSHKISKCGHIADEWNCLPLQQVCLKITDGTHLSPKSTSGTHMYITSKNIKPGKLDLSNINFISSEEHKQIYKACPVKYGDVLLTKDGANTGNAAINNIHDEISLLSSIAMLRTNEKIINSKFLLQFLMSPRGQYQLKADMEGQAITRLTLTKISDFNVPIPPLDEQIAISNVLCEWDRSIDFTDQLIATKREHRIWLMQQLLTGKHRAPGFSKKWVTKRMKDLVEPILRPVPKPTEAYKALGIRSHCKGTFERLVSDPKTVDMDELFIARKGDLIVNITFAWEGAIAFVPEEHDGNLVSHRFPTYTLKDNEVDADFLRYIVIQPRFIFTLVLISPGGAGRNRVMSKRDFLDIELSVPCLEEQRKIGKILKLADDEIALLSRQLDALREQKKGLMQKLLTGKVRVKV